MKVDIGFWNEQGEYIPDIQEVSEVEMDKEVIIDGVDVAGCVQLIEEPFYPCGLGGECEGWDNCYYKQLKRLEQENADLKKYIERMDKPVVEVIDADIALENTELKAENEQLKALCDTYKTCYQAKHSDIKCLLLKYRTTLQEIKAIAEAPKLFIDFSETKTATEVRYDYAAICNELELRLHKVLELITKVEEE